MNLNASARAARAARREERREEAVRVEGSDVESDEEPVVQAQGDFPAQPAAIAPRPADSAPPDWLNMLAQMEARIMRQVLQLRTNPPQPIARAAEAAPAAPAQPAPSDESERKLGIDKHPCTLALTNMSPDYKYALYTKADGPVIWMRKTFDFVERASYFFGHLPVHKHTRVIAMFMLMALEGGALDGWARCLVDSPGGRVERMFAFKDWKEMKEAIRAEIVTPTRRLDIERAFVSLTLSSDIDTLIRKIDDYTAICSMEQNAALVCKRNKIIHCLPSHVNREIQTTMMPPNESILDTMKVDLLVEHAKLAIERYNKMSKSTEEKKTPQVAATTVEQPVESANASGGAQRANTSRRKSQERFTPGGSATQNSNTKRDPEAQARSNANFANRLIEFDKRFAGVSKETILQRLDANVCPACSEKHRLAKCASKAFVPSN